MSLTVRQNTRLAQPQSIWLRMELLPSRKYPVVSRVLWGSDGRHFLLVRHCEVLTQPSLDRDDRLELSRFGSRATLQ